jgi:CheY-like chemotaxis protein
MLAGPDTQPLPNVPLIHRPTDQAVSGLQRPPLEVRKRHLVVDDELPILKLVTRILATDNYEVSSAVSGDEAAQIINAPGYPGVDLLVTDLMMPGLNGRELAMITRRRFPNVRVLYSPGSRTRYSRICRSSPTASRSSRNRSAPMVSSKRRGC